MIIHSSRPALLNEPFFMFDSLRPIFLLFPALMLLFACSQSSPPPATTQAVTVVTLQARPVTLTRELPGRTTPFLVAEVRPQATGIVLDQLFAEGSLVEAGQPLYQLDDASYRARYNSAKASLTRAQVALEVARTNAARTTELAKAGVISQQARENAVATLYQAEADVGVAKAELASAEVVLNYARISSPISGRIGKSSVTKGALVTANQDAPLATVQQLDPVYVDLTQSSSELLELRKELAAGTLTETNDVPVTILLEDGSPYPHAGKMKFADVSVDANTGSFGLRVVVPNPDHLLLPGMYVRALVSNGERRNGLLVPQQAIARDPKGNANAMVVAADGTVQPRTVQVNRTIGDQWLVDAGLQAGDRVIIEGLQKIKPGMPVQATEFVPPAATAAPGSDRPTVDTAVPPAEEAVAADDKQT
jgi:membrane fusion protein (multidrug efflux system)